MYQRLKSNDRILHCPENLGNNAKRLSDYEKTQGLNSWSISLRQEAFGFRADQTLVKNGSFILGELARWRLLWVAIFNFDVIHFNNGKTIMPHRVPFSSVRARTNWLIAALYSAYAWLLEGIDLPLLKVLGKRCYFTYQGSDARYSTHYTRQHKPAVLSNLNPDYLSPAADSFKQKRLRRSEKYAEAIFCLNPDLMRNFKSKANFLPYYNVNIDEIKAHTVFDKETIHIVHAPSKRDIKGTKFIIDAIKKVCLTNSNIRFTLVENMSNKAAQKIYDTADLFIDQLIVGWYGGVAVELMARGVPVMCYLEDTNDLHCTSELRAKLPILRTSIATIEEDLLSTLTRSHESLNRIGQDSLRFTNKFHSLQDFYKVSREA